MASTLTQMYVHCIFHTKNNVHIKKENLNELYSYIGGIIKETDSSPIQIGGTENHLHILVSLSKTISMSDFINKIKSGSSNWIKKKYPFYKNFSWQNGYGAFSVSQSLLKRTIIYIEKQEKHHKKTTFKEEYEAFLKAYNIEFDEKYAFVD